MNQARERACDWLMLGPIVGFTNQTHARVLAVPFPTEADKPGHYTADGLVLRIAKAAGQPCFDAVRGGFGPVAIDGPIREVAATREGGVAAAEFGLPGDETYFYTALFELTGLEPGARYFYEVVPREALTSCGESFASVQPYSFRTLPREATPIKFSFHSCNGLHKPPRGRRPTTMWQRLLCEALEDPEVYFAVMGGDQIYADVIREEWLREWDPQFDPRLVDDCECERFERSFERLPADFERLYRTFWRRPELRTFMGHMPCVMTWDDHDIYDGWGSHGDEALPAQRPFFRAAAAAFDAYQAQLAPTRSIAQMAGSTIDTDRGQPREHRGFSFMHGETAFLVPDLRSKRDIRTRELSAVLGDQQWRWLCHELKMLEQVRPKHIVLISTIPLAHMGATVENLVPNVAELHDDVLDHWSSRPNRNDQARLLGRLFLLRHLTGANVLILAGDVHVATVGEIRSSDPRFLRPGEREAVIYQGVSSAIAHEAPTGISANVVRYLVQRTHPLHGGFLAHISEVVAERNFAVVSCQPNGVLRFTLLHEGSEVPEQYYFGG